MTLAELKATADGLLEAAAFANPGLAFVIVVAEPDPAAARFAVTTNVRNVGEARALCNSARIALEGS